MILISILNENMIRNNPSNIKIDFFKKTIDMLNIKLKCLQNDHSVLERYDIENIFKK